MKLWLAEESRLMQIICPHIAMMMKPPTFNFRTEVLDSHPPWCGMRIWYWRMENHKGWERPTLDWAPTLCSHQRSSHMQTYPAHILCPQTPPIHGRFLLAPVFSIQTTHMNVTQGSWIIRCSVRLETLPCIFYNNTGCSWVAVLNMSSDLINIRDELFPLG